MKKEKQLEISNRMDKINEAIETCANNSKSKIKNEEIIILHISDAIKLYLIGYANGRQKTIDDASEQN